MSSKVFSAAIIGLECELVEVEADTCFAIPNIFIVGLPDKAVDESRERVRAAIRNAQYEVPRRKVTINLAPADIKKAGPSYDLPIALSIVLTSGQITPRHQLHKSIFIGELALDGSVRSVAGVLSVCLSARQWKMEAVYVPAANAAEAALVDGLEIYAIENFKQLLDHLSGKKIVPKYRACNDARSLDTQTLFDMAHVHGQAHVKRALEIAAAGGHNVLMSGPPGSGKTLLAKTMVSILPQLSSAESLDVTRIYSVAGRLPADQPLLTTRPFRSPHHTASGVALVGGGAWPRPGEISLAHRGVLFLDEFPEFPRLVLENLRQPLEDGTISVSRAAGTINFPAKFMLIAAMNPCPCGYATDPDHDCRCTPFIISKYQKKISGPLLDRIDLHVSVPKVKIEHLHGSTVAAESSAAIRERVAAARYRQAQRFTGTNLITNSEMSSQQTSRWCALDQPSREVLHQATERLKLSARSYFRILKLSRTIADLTASENIELAHVAEALQYRPVVSDK